MTNQNEQNVQNTTEQVPEVQKKEQIVHWGVKLPVSVKNRLSETLAQWKSDPDETQAQTIVKVLDAAQLTGSDVPEEVQQCTKETRDAVMILLKRINNIGQTASFRLDDLHKQLNDQIDKNNQLVEKHKEEIEKLNEQNKIVVDQLKADLKEQKEGTDSAVRTIQELRSTNGNLTTANTALKGQVKGLEERSKELKQELHGAKEALKQETLKLEDTVDTCNLTVKNREEELKKELADVRSKADAEMAALKQNHQVDLQRVQAQEQAKAAEKVAQLQSQLFDKFAGEKEKLANEKSDLKAQVASLQAELKTLKNQFETLKQQQ